MSTASAPVWSSRTGFLLATIGGAVGLGNVWRFPFIAGENGGAAFVLVYAACVIILGIPIMLAELLLGRRGKGSATATMRTLTQSEGAHPAWHAIGWISVLLPILGLAYYSVVAGWSLDYVVGAARGEFTGGDAAASGARFNALSGSAPRVLLSHVAFIALTVAIVGRGVQSGIERMSTWLMIGLFAILVVLVVYAASVGDFSAGVDFLFSPDFSQINVDTLVMALGQAFFSLAVATGMLITYGAYIPANISLGKSVLIIAAVDSAIALIAGLVIFPLVFANGLSASEGPGLLFVTLPIAFGNMPGGVWIGTLFFVLIAFAALTTGLGMLEPFVSFLKGRSRLSRGTLAIAAGALAWIIGVGPALSFNVLSDLRPLSWLPKFADKTLFDIIDYVVANVLLPLNGLLITLFAGWCLRQRTVLEETGWSDGTLYRTWRFVVRYLAPVVITIILYNSLIG